MPSSSKSTLTKSWFIASSKEIAIGASLYMRIGAELSRIEISESRGRIIYWLFFANIYTVADISSAKMILPL